MMLKRAAGMRSAQNRRRELLDQVGLRSVEMAGTRRADAESYTRMANVGNSDAARVPNEHADSRRVCGGCFTGMLNMMMGLRWRLHPSTTPDMIAGRHGAERSAEVESWQWPNAEGTNRGADTNVRMDTRGQEMSFVSTHARGLRRLER